MGNFKDHFMALATELASNRNPPCLVKMNIVRIAELIMNETFNNIIVGAGIAGLTLAYELRKTESTVVIEKSRGVGGRMATRRVGDCTYDHGAQFYVAHEGNKLDWEWSAAGLAVPWFARGDKICKASPGGITRLAKHLAQETRIELNCLIQKIEWVGAHWRVLGEEKAYLGNCLFLTPPLPQVCEILTRSNIPYPSELDQVGYTQAWVGLIEIETCHPLIEDMKYVENVSDEIFSISNQKSKGVSSPLAFTVVMRPEWSSIHFGSEEKWVVQKIQLAFEAYFASLKLELGSFKISKVSLKKWRFCQPRQKLQNEFLQLARGLYILGDAFGGPSVNGAYRSAQALARVVLQT